jgi:hypothetical protein
MGAEDNEFNHRDGVSLKEFMCERCDMAREGCNRVMITRFDSLDKALELRERVENEKFDKTNEWRATVGDVIDKKIDRTEYNEAHLRLEQRMDYKIGSVEEKLDTLIESVNAINISSATLEGKASQKQMTLALAISFSALLLTLSGIIVAVIVRA